MSSQNIIQSIWKYSVRTEFITQFNKAYGSNGDWARLFNKCPGYITTALLRDLDSPNRFVTIDYWRSYSAFESMRHFAGAAYETLDKLCATFTSAEKHIGVFECIDDWKTVD